MKYIFYLVVGCLVVSSIFAYEILPKGDVQGVKEEKDIGLTITFLDIGQGDATYLEFANGEDMLIDCAIDARILEALGRVMVWNDRVIDYLIITHPDLDHYGGCEEVMKRFDIKHVWYNGLKKEDSAMWRSFWTASQGEGEYVELQGRKELVIASTTIEFLYPDHPIVVDSRVPGLKKDTGSNDTSIVTKVIYGNTSVLLMADAEEPLEKYLIEKYTSDLDVDILKLGHHGSDSSSSEDFLEATSPSDAIVSAGEKNKYGHPSFRVLKRVERASSTVWRTDKQSDIVAHITRDGYVISTAE